MVNYMKKVRWSFVFNTAVIVICVSLILYFIFSDNGLRDLIKSPDNIAVGWLFAALACHIGNAAIDSLVTWQLTRIKYKRFGLKNAVKIAVTGHFFSAVTPGGSGGQPMQIYSMRTMGVDVGFSTAMLIQKFLVYQITATLYAIVFFALKSRFILVHIHGTIMILFVAVGFLSQVAVMVFLLLACFMPKLIKKIAASFVYVLKKIRRHKNFDGLLKSMEEKIDVFYNSNKEFIKRPRVIALSFAEICVQITLIYSVPYFIYKALVPNGTDSITMMICAMAFITVISSMIPLPGASGVSELAFSVFFSVFFTQTTLKSATLIWRTITYYFTIMLGAPFSIINNKIHGRVSYKEIMSGEENNSDDLKGA